MKYLVLCLALLSPEAFSAAGDTPASHPAGGAGAGSGAAAPAAPAAPAAAPAAAPLTTEEQKNLLPGKFVGDWKVTKENKELLYLDEIRDKGDQKVNVKQTEAYDLGMEVFKKCATVASEGRKDEVCANEPTNPDAPGWRAPLKMRPTAWSISPAPPTAKPSALRNSTRPSGWLWESSLR
jgi:hypothetical protein